MPTGASSNDDDPNVVYNRIELPPIEGIEDWRDWPLDAKQELLAKLEFMAKSSSPLPYWDEARPKQLPPSHPRHHLPDEEGNTCGCNGVDENFNVWLLMAGRGLGKTYTGSNWLVSQALSTPNSEWAILAPTFRDVQKTCFEGAVVPILSAYMGRENFQYRRNELQIILPNGAIIYGYTADNPERIRGTNLWGAWCDELGSWRYPETWYEGLVPAVRLPKDGHPRIVVTTTPRPTDLLLDLASRTDGSVHITRGSTWENRANLSTIALDEMRRRYEGTRIGRQELEGELLEDIEGALWTRAQIDETRLLGRIVEGAWFDPLDDIELTRVVVAIDPAVTSNEFSDETGIVVVGMDANGHGYVLEDLSLVGSPMECLKAAIAAYHNWSADSLVVEVNNGGDYIPTLLRTIDTNVPLRTVRATRGKVLRAEPVVSLYEQKRVHHLGVFGDLEQQMTSWTPVVKSKKSPDRIDALVWGFYDLKGLTEGDMHTAYGTTICSHCARGYVKSLHPKACPHCHQPVT